jgi:hypothetical protein
MESKVLPPPLFVVVEYKQLQYYMGTYTVCFWTPSSISVKAVNHSGQSLGGKMTLPTYAGIA